MELTRDPRSHHAYLSSGLSARRSSHVHGSLSASWPTTFRQPHQEYERGHRPGLIFFSPPMISIQLSSKTYPASLRTLPMFSEHEMMSHSPFPATWQPTIKAYPRHRPMNIRPKTLGSNMFAREKLATRNVPSYNKDPSPGQHLRRQLIRAVLKWHLGMYRVLSRPSA
jgi:hypothetical protein